MFCASQRCSAHLHQHSVSADNRTAHSLFLCWSTIQHETMRHVCLTRFPPSKHYHSVHGAALNLQGSSNVTCAAFRDHRGRYACVCHPLWMLSTLPVSPTSHSTLLLCQNLIEYKNRYLNIFRRMSIPVPARSVCTDAKSKHSCTFSVLYFHFSSCRAYKCDTAADRAAQFERRTRRRWCDMNSDENLRECKNVWTKWGRSAEESTANRRNVVQSA